MECALLLKDRVTNDCTSPDLLNNCSRVQPTVDPGIGTHFVTLLTAAAPCSIVLNEWQGKLIRAIEITGIGAIVGLWVYNKTGGAFGSMIGLFTWIVIEKLKDNALQ